MSDYVIQMDAVNGPCWVTSGGGDPERTHRIEFAERHVTRYEAFENASAFRRQFPARKFDVRALDDVLLELGEQR